MLADRRREPLQKQALLLQMKLRIQILIDFELEVPHFEATNGDLGGVSLGELTDHAPASHGRLTSVIK
ncbi:hypothetical protein B296_00000674 [Ensete ventricosum]|uniref:Uncharacterized protein n=1 Tax=Ensete ventricosum TaxID=4639 RepID=A0A427B1R0_ENSVE|nr:hypothetical protein B296_00000674 [Ensete ventricosum]